MYNLSINQGVLTTNDLKYIYFETSELNTKYMTMVLAELRMVQMHHVTFTHLSSVSASGFMSSSLLKHSLLEADESRLSN